MGVGPVPFNPDFAEIVNYLSWIYTHEFKIFSAIPQEVPKMLSLLLPLPPVVWFCFSGTMIFLTTIKYLLAIHSTAKLPTIYDRKLRVDGRRIIIAMSLFTGLTFWIFYVNSLESQLVAKEFEQPIDTIQDLLHSGLPTYYPGKTATAKFLVGHPSKEIRQIMKSKAKPFPFVGKIPSYVVDRFEQMTSTWSNIQ